MTAAQRDLVDAALRMIQHGRINQTDMTEAARSAIRTAYPSKWQYQQFNDVFGRELVTDAIAHTGYFSSDTSSTSP